MTFSMKPILPTNKVIVNPVILHDLLERAIAATTEEAGKDFQATTTAWDNRPQFESRRAYTNPSGDISGTVRTFSLIYMYLTVGTKAHPIRARRAPMLVFNWWGYGHDVAKTAPRWIGSRPAGPAGPLRRYKEVWHPGTVAREWPTVIVDLRLPKLVDRVKAAISDSRWR